MPLYRRLPKRGFNNRGRVEYAVINLSTLDKYFEEGATVDAAALLEKRIIKNLMDGVKVLGNGEITKKLTVKADAFSETAKTKIEGCGGTCEVI